MPRCEAASISITSSELPFAIASAIGVVGIEVGVRAAVGIQRLREDAGHRGLPRSARPGEDVRLPHLPVLDRVPQRADDRFLADHVAEVERAIGAVESGHGVILADGERSEPLC